jgi:peptidyl-prolyl cis-trans isomerase A (cyclophilin A)
MGKTHETVPRQDLIHHPQVFGSTVFGKVVSGMDTVEKIRNEPTGPGGPFPTDAPKKQVIIESARLVN